MRFRKGMGCCNPYREQVELSCDFGARLCCANAAIERMSANMPDGIPRLITTLFEAFPEYPYHIIQSALRYGQIDAAIARAAIYCASLPTKEERLAFKGQIAGYLGAHQLATFEEKTVAEFQRRKNQTNRGSK